MAHQSAQDKAVLYGLSRLRAGLQFAIAWFQGLTALGSRGQIKNVVLGTNLTGTVGPDDTLTIDASGGGGGSSTAAISATFDGDGTALAGTVTSPAVWVPYDFVITGWHLGGDGSLGSGTVDVEYSTDQASWTSITAAATPSVSSARAGSSTTLTGWTTTLTGGVWLRAVGSGWAAWTGANLTLTVTR